MMRSTLVLLMALTGTALVAGCQETGLVETDAGTTDSGGGTDRDSGPPPAAFTYAPTGCDYTVSAPDRADAHMGEDTFGAAPTFDHVHVSWAGPTHASFAVNWRSDSETLASSVLYGTDQAAVMAADGPGDGVMLQAGHTILFEDALSGNSTRVHEAHVCGLSADTRYYYRVGGPGHWSPVYETVTGPMPGSRDPFTFGVSGDSRGNDEEAWPISQRRMRDAMVELELFSGDAVVIGTNQPEWDDFWSADDGMGFDVQQLFASVPLMMANGNHDALSVNFVAQTAFPQEVSPQERAQGEEWYSFDYANAHFVMLDDNDRELYPTSEADWLESDLAAARANPDIDWIFVTHHRPFYTCMSNHSPDTSLRAAWQEIFDRHRVDVVFTGHNHVYERSRPIRGLMGGQGVVAAQGSNGVPQIEGGNASGTVYIVAAGVGAPLYNVETSCPTSYSGRRERTYVTVTVTGTRIELVVRNALTDAMVETFGWDKAL